MAAAKKKVVKEQYVVGYDDGYFDSLNSEFFPSEQKALDYIKNAADDYSNIVLLKVVKKFTVERTLVVKEIK